MILPRSIIRLALAAAFGLSALPCSAQQQQVMPLQFMTFPMVMEPLEVELLIGDGKTVILNVPSNEFSETVRVPLMTSLVFGKTVTDGVDKKPSFKIYGQGKPVAASKQLVLLIRKGAAMSDGVEVRAISGDLEAFSGGKLLFMNATKVSVGGKTGGQPFALKPGEHSIIKPKLEANGRLTFVEFFYALDGKAVPFFSTMWPVADHYRGLVFFYHDPNDENKIRIHSFREFLQAGG